MACKSGLAASIGAGSVVTKNVPPRSMVVGVPAKILRQLSEDEVAGLMTHAERYYKLALVHGGKGTDLGFAGALALPDRAE
jgi:carbonic anhydrase/acetyltransferase-like protein (isoleucine patch superfamily)